VRFDPSVYAAGYIQGVRFVLVIPKHRTKCMVRRLKQYDTCFIILMPVSTTTIQGDSGGKLNILGGDSIGHCEKHSSYEHVSDSKWLPRHSCLNLET
jgi:hypothetical protein